MSSFTVVMIFSGIIVCLVIGLTIWSTNKAYEVLPTSSKVDPLPEHTKNEINETKS
ncbi:YtzI protein [Bacillus sp. Marseille-P3661]|uniref:YtzI protein n=1 Tax=Bacillus sp. Marseille-P3661 TaxID=1936234 RepID=UPI00115A5C0F|nr:YtzI protein [Bacillus sp. Marseille-P3661]